MMMMVLRMTNTLISWQAVVKRCTRFQEKKRLIIQHKVCKFKLKYTYFLEENENRFIAIDVPSILQNFKEAKESAFKDNF